MPPYPIEWLDEARADVRALDQPTAMRILASATARKLTAETGRSLMRPVEKTRRLAKLALPPVQGQIGEGPQRHASGALRHPRLAVVQPAGAGYVEVDPRLALHKLLDELGCGNGTAPAAADVRNVGERGLQVFLIVVI